jgi:hypothetical protein
MNSAIMRTRSVLWHGLCSFSQWGWKNQIDQADLKRQNVSVSWSRPSIQLRHVAVQKTVPMTNHQIVKAGAIYFALVFGAGFVLGTIRVLWLVPIVGTRTAELLEAPIMFAVIILSARWVVRKGSGTICAQRPSGRSDKWFLTPWLGVGGLALILALLFDFTVILRIRGLSFAQYVETFDPVAGTAYFVMLGVFAVMPLLVARRERSEMVESA